MKKKGAIELSIGTIVIIVLSMSMLILGLVLVKNIFSGASENILALNDKVKDKINEAFEDQEKKTVVYLPNAIAKIEQNKDWGVAFAIKNLDKGTVQAGKFDYEVLVSDPDLSSKCGIGEADVIKWVKTGRKDTINLAPGEIYYGIARFFIPENAPLCVVRFHIEVKLDNNRYATDFFDVEVKP